MYFNVKPVEFSYLAILYFVARQNNLYLIWKLPTLSFQSNVCERSAKYFREKNDIPKASNATFGVAALLHSCRPAYKNCAEGNYKIPAGFRSCPMIEILTARCHRTIIFIGTDLKEWLFILSQFLWMRN